MADNDDPPADDPSGGGNQDPPKDTSPADPPHGGDDKGGDPTDWKSESRKHEKRAKDSKTALDKAQADLQAARDREKAILKAAGLAEDDDPAEAAKKNAAERDTAVTERDEARAALKLAERSFAALEHARDAGADAALIRDSKAFDTFLAGLDDDVTDADLGKAMGRFVKDNPRFKTAAAPPPTSDPTNGGEPRIADRDVTPGMGRLRAAFK
ncbi:hypothetical protein [Actinomycetospora aeridis]|uniref:Scaffolding protein n=1 Tax=Actinomycetospora aeridis TaxID=3129231 RepID=A0ABU8N3B9_9PSEU